jgi:hypothetical protein
MSTKNRHVFRDPGRQMRPGRSSELEGISDRFTHVEVDWTNPKVWSAIIASFHLFSTCVLHDGPTPVRDIGYQTTQKSIVLFIAS